jgi:nitrate reductase delta subunit
MSTRTWRALGALLDYPQEEQIAALAEIAAVLDGEALLSPAVRAGLDRLIADLGTTDLFDLQEGWLVLFDRSRARSLHLYEHVHGESRDRGQAMASLLELYRFHGLELTSRELPDYLPLLCEFLSVIEPRVARSILADAAHILEAVRLRLTEKSSAYAGVFAALLELAQADIDGDRLAEVLKAEPAEDDDPAKLDREWEESAVLFGPGDAAAGCGGAMHYRRPTAA